MAVPDFKHWLRDNVSTKSTFNIFAFSFEFSTQYFLSIARESSAAVASPFHHYINNIATEGRLVRQYTQKFN